MIDGFNPYSNLTKKEMLQKGGTGDSICYGLRVGLHLFMLLATVYIITMLVTKYIVRNIQRFPGQMTWIVMIFSRMPYGSLFFQEGEYFDCAICLEGIWQGSTVVRLACGDEDSHAFHSDCLRDQVALHGNKYCVVCETQI